MNNFRAGLLGRLRAGRARGSLVPVYLLHGKCHPREVTASGHQWEDHPDDDWYSSNGGGGGGFGGGWFLFISHPVLCCSGGDYGDHILHLRSLRVLQDVLAAEARVQGPGREFAANDTGGVELTAPATTVNAPPPLSGPERTF